MSRQAQLPPRCPLQKKTASRPPSWKYIELQQKSMLQEQPAWLDDLLSDSDSNSSLHRAASDSSMLSDGLVSLTDLDMCDATETGDSFELDNNGLESSCMYGPNSPRRKNKSGFDGKEIVSAFSEYVMQSPLQQLNVYASVSGMPQLDSFGDACASAGESNTENKPMKRHPGQRSRVRKLQYIAELERTVDILQNLGSDLTIRVSSLLQQYSALSVENNTLKQKLLRMQQEKFNVDGEYQSLRKEVEMLKFLSTVSPSNNKVHNRSLSAAHSDAIWNMIDLGKLDLN